MPTVNATGSKVQRFRDIDQSLINLIYGSDTSVWINRSAGNGAFSYTVEKLMLLSERAKYHFPVTVVRLSHCNTVEDVRQAAIKNGGIVVIDEAQHIDRIPGAAEALRALESPYIKVVYVALVHEPKGLVAKLARMVAGG